MTLIDNRKNLESQESQEKAHRIHRDRMVRRHPRRRHRGIERKEERARAAAANTRDRPTREEARSITTIISTDNRPRVVAIQILPLRKSPSRQSRPVTRCQSRISKRLPRPNPLWPIRLPKYLQAVAKHRMARDRPRHHQSLRPLPRPRSLLFLLHPHHCRARANNPIKRPCITSNRLCWTTTTFPWRPVWRSKCDPLQKRPLMMSISAERRYVWIAWKSF